MIKVPIDPTVELRSADGTSSEYYQTNETHIQEARRLLADPRLLAQRHLLLSSRYRASMIPCQGIDMVIVCTSVPLPLRFPLNLPAGRLHLTEQPEDMADDDSAAPEEPGELKPGEIRRHTARVQIRTLGGWAVSLQAVATIRGHLQDQRQSFSHLPEHGAVSKRRIIAAAWAGVMSGALTNVTCPDSRASQQRHLPTFARHQWPSETRAWGEPG